MSRSNFETPRGPEPSKPDARPRWTALDRMVATWGQSDALILANAFVECCKDNCPLDELVRTFQIMLERLGFRYFACCSHVDPIHPPQAAVMFHNYPDAWARVFSELALYEEDPVLLYAEQCELPFRWDDQNFLEHVTRDQKIILSEGASLGLAGGFTIPIHSAMDSGALHASCSIVPDSGPIDAGSYHAVQLMATYLYHTANRQLNKQHAADGRVELPLRERQCLQLVALGKSDWVVGRILGLSASTVHTYIERAKRRMGVATRMQAVARALAARQISCSGVTRSERPESSGDPRGTGVRSRAPDLHETLVRELRHTSIPDLRRLTATELIRDNKSPDR